MGAATAAAAAAARGRAGLCQAAVGQPPQQRQLEEGAAAALGAEAPGLCWALMAPPLGQQASHRTRADRSPRDP